MKALLTSVIIIVGSVLSELTVKAEALQLAGQIIEQGTRLPVEFASVALYRADSVLAKGALTDSAGRFILNGLSPGRYYLVAVYMGYEKLHRNGIDLSGSSPILDLGPLELIPLARELREISVTATGPSVRITADRYIISADKNSSASGGNAADLLKTAPGVREDQDGKLSIQGDPEFTVLINGQPTSLPAQDILRQTPASQIEKIEVMTHPSAKYASGGTAGIINIILKKNSNPGLNGMVSATLGLYDKYSAGLQLNRNGKKIQLSWMINWKDETIVLDHRYYKTRNLGDTIEFASMLQDRHMQDKLLESRFNISLTPSEKSQWNYSLHGGQTEKNILINASLEGYNNQGSEHQYNFNVFDVVLRPTFLTQNISFERKLKKEGSNFSANAFYSYIDYYMYNTQVQSKATSSFEPLDPAPGLHRVVNSNFSNEAKVDLDWTLPVNESFQLETGLSGRHYGRVLNVAISDFNYSASQWSDDTLYTGEYRFREQVTGAYLNSHFTRKQLKLSVGVRAEYMDRTLMKSSNGVDYPFSRVHLFPNLSAEHALGEKWMLTANYSSRINRPDEYQMNPFPEFEDPYFYAEGNPELRPEISHRGETGARRILKKGSVTGMLFTKYTQDRIFQELIVRPDGKLKVISSNRATDLSMGLDLNGNYNPVRWLNLQAGASLYQYSIEGMSGTESFKEEGWMWSASLMGAVQLRKNLSLQAVSVYNSKEVYALGYSGDLWLMNLGLECRLLKERLSANISFRDVFQTGDFFVHTTSGDTDMDAYYYNEQPSIRVSLNYNFRQFKKMTRDVETKFDM